MDITNRTFAVFQCSVLTVGLKNREANVLDYTDIPTIEDALLVTFTKSLCSFFVSRTIVKRKKLDYKSELRKM
jgi:hypothetical protein